MRLPVLPAVLLAASLLAGCSDAPAGTDGPDPTGTGTDAAGILHDLAWAAAATAVVAQHEGTFRPDENGGLQQVSGADTGGVHAYPLDVPPGVPVLVRLTLDAQTTAGDLGLALSMPFEAIFTSDCDCPQGGRKVLEAAVVLPAGEAAEAVVTNLNPEPGPVAYTLTAEVHGDAQSVPSGIPVAVALRNGSSVHVTAAGDAHNDVLVFGPDDALVAVLPPAPSSTFTITDPAATGEYVLVHAGHAVAARYSVGFPEADTPAPLARLLRQVIEATDPVPVQAGAEGETTTTMTADRTPLQVGACVGGQHAASEYELGVEGPDGATLASNGLGLVLTTLPYGDCVFTPMGDARLLPGDHTVRYRSQADDGGSIQGWIVHYGR